MPCKSGGNDVSRRKSYPTFNRYSIQMRLLERTCILTTANVTQAHGNAKFYAFYSSTSTLPTLMNLPALTILRRYRTILQTQGRAFKSLNDSGLRWTQPLRSNSNALKSNPHAECLRANLPIVKLNNQTISTRACLDSESAKPLWCLTLYFCATCFTSRGAS